MATIYMESIRIVNAPCIQNAVESTAKIENEQAIKESLSIYIERFKESVKFPTKTPEEMCNCHAKCSKSVFDSQKVYYQQMAVQVEEIYADFSKNNEIQSGEACKKQLENLYQESPGNDYLFGGGYRKYEDDMQKLVDTYKETPHLEDVAARLSGELMKGKEPFRQTILNVDIKFTEAEKLEKDLKASKEALQLAEKAMGEAQKTIKLLEKQRKQSKKKHVERLVADAEKDRQIKRSDKDRGVVKKIEKLVENIWGIPFKMNLK